MTVHFYPPWTDDRSVMVSATLIERHSAKCRALKVPDATPPADVAARMTMAPSDLKIQALADADEAVARYERMIAWRPADYDPQGCVGLRERMLSNEFDHMCLWGARGGGKSHLIADVVVELASIGTERVLCCREFMNSTSESVRDLLVSKIKASRWANQWTCLDTELRNEVTGSKVTFIGLARNPTAQKSMAGITLVWNEEAADLSQLSIDLLVPTVMREGNSRIIWSYNPQKNDTPVDVMFRQGSAPERALVVGVMPEDNPYFYRGKMGGERRSSFANHSAEKYRWIWRGAYETRSELAVYQNWVVGRADISCTDLTPRYGLDWGWVHPMACVEFFVIEPDDPETERGIIYVTGELYGSKIPAKQIPQRLDETLPMARNHTITADSAEPKSIDDLGDAGFQVVPAKKGPGSIRAGISTIQGYDIYVSPDCPNVASELASYSWKTDRTGKVMLRDPVDADNDLMDALRYGMEDYVPPPKGGGVVYV